MSKAMPGELSAQDVIDSARCTVKCRIPQRLPQNRTRQSSNSIVIPRNATVRPKSANKLKEDLYSRQGHAPSRPRPVERASLRPSTSPRKSHENHKGPRPIIVVPMPTIPAKRSHSINTEEDSEVQLRHTPPMTVTSTERSDTESLPSPEEKLTNIKIIWQNNLTQFEKMKIDLRELQKCILVLYAKMRDTHQVMLTLGEKPCLPATDDLRIMNVTNLSSEQLLQLSTGDLNEQRGTNAPLGIDLAKVYEMPTKLVDFCDKILATRKDVAHWIESLKTAEKGMKISKKIDEFTEENKLLKCSLERVKTDFLMELEDVVNLMRKGVNETTTLQLRVEELTSKMTELNSQNTELRKQIHNVETVRSQTNKTRIEELEKELKDEKSKRSFMKDRLSRSEGQVKINAERVCQLEATLKLARSQIWTLERTVQQLHEQNQKLQSDFDKELNKLTESIIEHTKHLEEIAETREKLQTEKEDLEKRLKKLSECYNESIESTKREMNGNIEKLIATEKKYNEQEEEKKELEVKIESLCAHLLEAELRQKNTLQQLHEKEAQLVKELETREELETAKAELEKTNLEMHNDREQLTKQNETIRDVELRLKESVDVAEELKCELSAKNEYIAELEQKQGLLEHQLQDNENKMEGYVEQLSSLKVHINQLQKEFGEFENLDELHEMVNEQRAKLLEVTRQNGELADALQKKDAQLEQLSESLAEHEQLLLERESAIKVLSEKEHEQNNIVKILRNNLELRSQADDDLNQQVVEKNTQIEALLANLDTRKQQITNMEKILLTFEDQSRKASLQRKKDQEHIAHLQKRIAEYESFHIEATRNINNPENLDSLIKILEDELGDDNELTSKDHANNYDLKKKYLEERKRDKFDLCEDIRYPSELDDFPTKIVLGNCAKKANVEDNLGRKKAITNIDTQKWVPTAEPELNVYAESIGKENSGRSLPAPNQNTPFARNLHFLNPESQRDSRKYKMFKLAGHRL